MKCIVPVVVVIVLIKVAVAIPLARDQVDAAQQENVINYLTRYGYLKQLKSHHGHEVTEAIKKLQWFFRLSQTGVVDAETLKIIKTPRCGFPDIDNRSNQTTRKIFDKRHITYYVANHSPLLSYQEVDDSVDLSMYMWTRDGGLTYARGGTDADIATSFVPREHGDGYPFDGPWGVVAHAFDPSDPVYSGDVHFDREEPWAALFEHEQDKIDFFSIALHEIGHAFGLGHSPTADAVMHPNYHFISKTEGLTYEDRMRMYELYNTQN